MATPPPIGQITMRNANAYFGRLAMTNYYQLFITDGWNSEGFREFLKKPEVQSNYGIDYQFATGNMGLLCSEAVLPASAYATSEVKDNFIGVTQEFAHTRLYTDIDLVFYIDKDYKVLGFFEAWMDYISGGGEIPLGKFEQGYYRRFNYPDFYKTDGIYIKKFERDFATGGTRNVTYRLKNAFPKSMSSIPVAYGGADLLKVSVSFNYDYYYIYRESALISNNPSTPTTKPKSDSTLSQKARSIEDNKADAIQQSLGGFSPAGESLLESYRETGAGRGPGLNLNDFQNRA